MADFHEAPEVLTPEIKDFVRAHNSLKEEIEAIDWYQQRMGATDDDSLKAILEHNRDEEIEHACMALEWLRRRIPAWDEALRLYLFTEKDITEIEEEGEAEDGGAKSSGGDLKIGALKTQ
jgi:hypothetical protein